MKIPEAKWIEFSKRRYALVQQLPRLCFAASDLIMYRLCVLFLIFDFIKFIYVVKASVQQTLVNELKAFVTSAQDRLGRAWSVDLIIVFNSGNFNDAKYTIEELSEIWQKNFDEVFFI